MIKYLVGNDFDDKSNVRLDFGVKSGLGILCKSVTRQKEL